MKTIKVKTTGNDIGKEGVTMISDVMKTDMGMISRLRGFKPNTTLTSLNLSGNVR